MLSNKGTVTVKSDRITLRRLTLEDAPAMFENWAKDPLTSKYLSWTPHESVEKTKELLSGWIADYSKPDCYHWVIEIENGDIIGTINFHNISDRTGRLELGYCIGSRWWNKGYVTEAVRALMKFAFTELGAHKVSAMHDVDNIASGRVMQKNGMIREGVLREHSLRKDGSYGDLACYSILKNEWSVLTGEGD